MNELNQIIDPWLIVPYRWLEDPVLAWWLGTLVLALWCLLLGKATLALGQRLNRASLDKTSKDASQMQATSMQALKAGDKGAYKALNKLANEAFGRSFFLRAALGASSLWPAFLAVGWLQKRFAEMEIPLPGLGLGLNYVAGFLVCLLGLHLAIFLLKRLARRAGSGAGAAR